MIRSLYDWVIRLAGHPRAIPAMGVVSFLESSFFPIPPDVMLVPMVLANRAKAFRKACSKLGLKHIFTRPYRPQTNGKAERFIQTALREWAYARAYETSDQRADHLPNWLHYYNWHRPHGSLNSKPPISRLALHVDDLLRFHS